MEVVFIYIGFPRLALGQHARTQQHIASLPSLRSIYRRFTRLGDTVLVTAADKEPLAAVVLGSGRKLTAFLSDPANEEKLEDDLNDAVTGALGRGFFSLGKSKLVHGPALPKQVPADNFPADARDWMGKEQEQGDGDGDPPALSYARKSADDLGLVIKVSVLAYLGFRLEPGAWLAC